MSSCLYRLNSFLVKSAECSELFSLKKGLQWKTFSWMTLNEKCSKSYHMWREGKDIKGGHYGTCNSQQPLCRTVIRRLSLALTHMSHLFGSPKQYYWLTSYRPFCTMSELVLILTINFRKHFFIKGEPGAQSLDLLLVVHRSIYSPHCPELMCEREIQTPTHNHITTIAVWKIILLVRFFKRLLYNKLHTIKLMLSITVLWGKGRNERHAFFLSGGLQLNLGHSSP